MLSVRTFFHTEITQHEFGTKTDLLLACDWEDKAKGCSFHTKLCFCGHSHSPSREAFIQDWGPVLCWGLNSGPALAWPSQSNPSYFNSRDMSMLLSYTNASMPQYQVPTKADIVIAHQGFNTDLRPWQTLKHCALKTSVTHKSWDSVCLFVWAGLDCTTWATPPVHLALIILEMGSHELFAQADSELQSSWSLPPK
jgi:hypothetical protein